LDLGRIEHALTQRRGPSGSACIQIQTSVAINVPPVTDDQNQDNQAIEVTLENDAMIAHSQAPLPITTDQMTHVSSTRLGISSQSRAQSGPQIGR
jgi:hypothetical protein